ncbi:MAG: ABC transporter substrate-binding protein [Ruminococcus sp.]
MWDENNQPQPALCDTYGEVSDDKLTYTFHLRDGIQWSNGEPVTAADFVYAWLKQMSADANKRLQLHYDRLHRKRSGV